MEKKQSVLIDGSRVIIESMVNAGAEVFIGYPITPANLLYAYGRQRFPVFIPASDEITALQKVAGFAAAGKLAITATSFPGFALMVETLNMAYMMELPLVIILVQRLGPSTGSATTGAQGDLLLLRGAISGGYPLPVFCPADLEDCWDLAAKSLTTAVSLRTPVILLTSKEMMMTNRSCARDKFPPVPRVENHHYQSESAYIPYSADNQSLVPPFLPLGNNIHQVRINASTHDAEGMIRKATPEAMANTARLRKKIENRVSEYCFYNLDYQENSNILIVSYGISAPATFDAVNRIRAAGGTVSNLTLKTLLPAAPKVMEILNHYQKIIFVEENSSGSLKEILYGQTRQEHIHCVNKVGNMISPLEIVEEVARCQRV